MIRALMGWAEDTERDKEGPDNHLTLCSTCFLFQIQVTDCS